MLDLNPRTTALVLIDLQKRILGMATAPYSAHDVVVKAAGLAHRFRALKSPVVLVTVSFRTDGKDRLSNPVDAPAFTTGAATADGAALAPELGSHDDDILVTKRQWGAFYGTDLDLQLRRRGVETIVLGGIATNFGVESTARDAWERNYKVVFAEDAMASTSLENHGFAVNNIFPRLGRVRTTDQILTDLA